MVMRKIKKLLGIVWMLIGPLFFILLVISAFKNIQQGGQGDISNPVPWIIIIAVSAPISIGLTIFGWYSWKGEYDSVLWKYNSTILQWVNLKLANGNCKITAFILISCCKSFRFDFYFWLLTFEFFSRISGIKFYGIVFGNDCVNKLPDSACIAIICR